MWEKVDKELESLRPKEGKLTVEWGGEKYHLVSKGKFGDKCFVNESGEEALKLNQLVGELYAKEMLERSPIDYWWESTYSIARRAMENAKIKVIEFIDEEYPLFDKDRNPIIY